MFKTSAQLRLENLALRQQLTVLRRSAPERLKLTRADRIFWVWLRRVWGDWKSVLMIVKAETVIAWHSKGFRLFWTWRIHRGKPGRKVPQEIRDLIRMLSRKQRVSESAHERCRESSPCPVAEFRAKAVINVFHRPTQGVH